VSESVCVPLSRDLAIIDDQPVTKMIPRSLAAMHVTVETGRPDPILGLGPGWRDVWQR